MATRPVRGDPDDIRNAAEKNRRPLGDIGNVDSLVGIEGGGKINRRITRNALIAAAADKKQINGAKALTKKQEAGRVVQKKSRATKPASSKELIVISPDTNEVSKPTEVIVISPDTNEVSKPKENRKSASKNKVTFSSVLKARSKAVSKTLDIDYVDKDNDLAAVEYVGDMYKFYKEVENETKPQMYMHIQPEINEKMRTILVDWVVDVHAKFDLSPETLYLTINITDRFLSLKPVPRRELQLVGVGAMIIASKYEEIWPPQVGDLVAVTNHSYSNKEILVMEKTILGNLEWYLTVPTQYVFLVRFIKASNPDSELENMVHFIAELGMMHHDSLMFCPSMLAASAVYTARCCLNKTPYWTDTLKFHTGYSESQLMDCSKLLAFNHSKVAESKLRGALKKYSKVERNAVAFISPAKFLLSAS